MDREQFIASALQTLDENQDQAIKKIKKADIDFYEEYYKLYWSRVADNEEGDQYKLEFEEALKRKLEASKTEYQNKYFQHLKFFDRTEDHAAISQHLLTYATHLQALGDRLHWEGTELLQGTHVWNIRYRKQMDLFYAEDKFRDKVLLDALKSRRELMLDFLTRSFDLTRCEDVVKICTNTEADIRENDAKNAARLFGLSGADLGNAAMHLIQNALL